MPNKLLEAIGGLGTILGTPGAVVTTAIGSRDPLRALRAIANPEERLYGADLLGGGDDFGTQAAGIGIDMLADMGLGIGAYGALRGGRGLAGAIRNSGRTFGDLVADESGTLHIPNWFSASSPEQQEFYSRLREAIASGPKKYVSSGQRTANDQLMGYLKNRASPQEVEWTLGNQFADAGTITQQSLMDAIERNGINLDVVKRGGPRTGEPFWIPGLKVARTDDLGVTEYAYRPLGAPVIRDEAIREARLTARSYKGLFENETPFPVIKRVRTPAYGPLEYPDMLLPGGRDTTETLLRMPSPEIAPLTAEQITDDMVRQWIRKEYPDDGMAYVIEKQLEDPAYKLELKHHIASTQYFPSQSVFRGEHWGLDDKNLVGWNVADTREMAGGEKMRLLQEVQSDWGQRIAKYENALKKYGTADAAQAKIESIRRHVQSFRDSMSKEELMALDDVYGEAHDAAIMLREGPEPPMPFARNNAAASLALKKAIYDAAKEGSDAFAIMPGELVQAIEGGVPRGQIINYNSVLPNEMKAAMKPFGVKQLEMMPLVRQSNALSEGDAIAMRNAESILGMSPGDSVPPPSSFVAAGPGKGNYITPVHQQYARALARLRGAPGFRMPPELREMILRRGFPILSMLPAAYAGNALSNAIQS